MMVQIRNGRRAYTVGELTRYIKTLLMGQRPLQNIAVCGEISNLRRQQSGHVYFTLKDDTSSLSCVMFRSFAIEQAFTAENGMKVWALGSVGVYEVGGRYQLYVEKLEPVGQGALQLAFEQLKKRLEAEGLFDQDRKRPIPKVPKGIGLVTSPTGAAIRDLISVIRRRCPSMPIVVSPALVQGKEAPRSICQALERLNQCDCIDVIVVARGGGSVEDLWCFNDETVARAIANSRYPVVSAVGHETDVTIVDFVSDLRAPTPSAAAELVAPERRALEAQLQQMVALLEGALDRWLWQKRQRYERCAEKLMLYSPDNTVKMQIQRTDELVYRMVRSMQLSLKDEERRLASVVSQLDQLSPLATLKRGYAVCRRIHQNGGLKVVRSVSQLVPGDHVEVMLQDGGATCEVKERWHKRKVEGVAADEV